MSRIFLLINVLIIAVMFFSFSVDKSQAGGGPSTLSDYELSMYYGHLINTFFT